MELLVTLRNGNYIDKLSTTCDGIIVGTVFSSGYPYTPDDLSKIKEYCKRNLLKLYVTIDNFINEDEEKLLVRYLSFLAKLDVDGIYYHDLGVYNIAKELDLVPKLIYDGQTVLCNSLDVAYHLSKGISGVKISNELTLEEMAAILKNNPTACDMQIFGHLRLSYSKRKFLSNYFKQINKEYDYIDKKTLYLVEEQRDYKMPIIEDGNCTKIYSDYVLEMYRELPFMSQYIKRGIVESLFLNDNQVVQVLRDYKRLNIDNCKFMQDNFFANFPDNYSSAYLYEKTNITKDE